MDDPFFNLDDWYQIVLLLIVFGGWILRAIFQAFGKATGRRPAQPNRPEAAPGKGLREFLQEADQLGGDGSCHRRLLYGVRLRLRIQVCPWRRGLRDRPH